MIPSSAPHRTSGLLLLAGLGVLPALPAIVRGFPRLSHDGAIHVIASSRFADQLWQGEWYPRWIQEMNGGLGSPLGFFYPPVAYYAASLFRPFFPGDVEGWMPLGASAGLALAGSGVLAYPWLRQFANPRAALAGALAYLASPYHVAVDLYLRGAIAELWAFVWMPLVLFFAGVAARKPAAAGIGLAVSYALLVMTHLPTALLFSLLPLVYGVAVAARDSRLRAGLAIGASLLAGLGLAAIYLAPALATQASVQMERMRMENLHYSNHFLFGSLAWSSMIGKLTVAMTAMIGLAVAASAAAGGGVSPVGSKQRRLWLAVALGSFALMLPVSEPIWRGLPLLQRVQFPFRLGTVLTVALAALVALAVAARERRDGSRASRIAVGAALLFVGICGVITVRAVVRGAFPAAASEEERRNVRERIALARGPGEYLPRWAGPLDAAKLSALASKRAGRTGELVSSTASENGTALVVREWKPRRIEIEADTASAAELTLNRFYYPGWAGSVENGPKVEARPSTPDGLLQLTVPGGRHRILLRLESGAAERAGAAVSAGFASLLLSAAILLAWRRRRERSPA